MKEKTRTKKRKMRKNAKKSHSMEGDVKVMKKEISNENQMGEKCKTSEEIRLEREGKKHGKEKAVIQKENPRDES